MANGQTVIYGPTLGTEMGEAGLKGLPISWTAYEMFGRENLDPQQTADLDAVLAVHDPTKQLSLPSVAEFIGRFTNAEYRAATAAAWRGTAGNAKNWDVVVFDSNVNMSRKKTQTLKTSLVTDGILTAVRADEIFK